MSTNQRVAVTRPSQRFSDQPDVLDQITRADTNLCLWQRAPSAEIAHELATLGSPFWRDIRLSTSETTFQADIGAHLVRHGTDPSTLPAFRADLQQVARRFFALSKGLTVRFRLYTTADDDCRRFHVDYRYLRLLCTYQGPGTEWLSAEQTDRQAYESGGPNSSIIRSGEPGRFETFWVGFFKDDAYPGCEGHGLMHRSPPASESDQLRVVFCLDAAPGGRRRT